MHNHTPYVWDLSLSVGIELLDAQHRDLIVCLNRLLDAIEHKADAKTLDTYIKTMVNQAVLHLETEELMMIQHRYHNLDTHLLEHSKIRNKIFTLLDLYHDGRYALSIDTTNFLYHLFKDHIMNYDLLYRQSLETHHESA